VARYDFLDQPACEHALGVATAVQPKGIPQVTGVCVPKDWLRPDEEPGPIVGHIENAI
jgi:hypothetical protein